jgi:hypothetical protein
MPAASAAELTSIGAAAAVTGHPHTAAVVQDIMSCAVQVSMAGNGSCWWWKWSRCLTVVMLVEVLSVLEGHYLWSVIESGGVNSPA